MIEIEWSKIKNPDSKDSLRHCDGYDDEYFRDYNWKNHILNEHVPEDMNYYSVKGFSTGRDIEGHSICRYDIFFWKEKPKLVEE